MVGKRMVLCGAHYYQWGCYKQPQPQVIKGVGYVGQSDAECAATKSMGLVAEGVVPRLGRTTGDPFKFKTVVEL